MIEHSHLGGRTLFYSHEIYAPCEDRLPIRSPKFRALRHFSMYNGMISFKNQTRYKANVPRSLLYLELTFSHFCLSKIKHLMQNLSKSDKNGLHYRFYLKYTLFVQYNITRQQKTLNLKIYCQTYFIKLFPEVHYFLYSSPLIFFFHYNIWRNA